MKFYIASSFANKDKVREAASILRGAGHVQTFDWTVNLRASSVEDLELYGTLEKKAVLEADFLIVLLPAGKGSHIELGIALGQGKTVYLLSESEELFDFEVTSTFYYLPEVRILVGKLRDNIETVQKFITQQKSVR
ncbi:group-specific protein [Planomicrobium okeanokoites]|uniref:Group-specific protein n=1 Tax=Planomicrobium okeanokoites TaxID=244 RepID=A0ABV7KST7_PLAOK|nr:group-specific protein [Planomicrobium okeanokoites]TAA70726.1 group-specific protein [Planomicrobium okeanokoites]